MTFRTDWVVDSHPAILDGFVTMFREELEAQKEQEQPFVKQFYVVENLQAAPLKIERFGNLDDAMSQYQALPNHYMKSLGVEKNPDPMPGSLDVLQCKNGLDTIVEDYKTVPGWDNPYIQNHVVQPLQGALACRMWSWHTNCRMPIFTSRPATMASTIPYIIRTSRNGMAVSLKRMEISLCRRL